MADFNLTYLWLLLLVLIFPLSVLAILVLIVRPRPVKIRIKNRHVLITGGSSGIGLALAHQAAAEGARVSILARSLEKLEQAKDSIQRSTGVEVAIFAVDVRDFDSVKKAVADAGPIDVLVVNQGVFVPQELDKQGLDEIKFMIDVNLIGSFNMIKAVLPGMKKRKDRSPTSIALMSSQAGQVGIYGYTAYSASKFGLRGLAEALQQEVIADNIHVSLIFPPDTDTPGFAEENKLRPQLTSIIAGSTSAMKPEEVAKKALDGIKFGGFFVNCNFEGTLLSIATAGLSPQRSSLMAFVEVFLAGLIRLVALCFQWNWYGLIEKWHKKIGNDDDDVELSVAHLKKFSLEELQVATNSFRNEQSSKLYQGVLKDGSLVIVKRLRSDDTPGEELQFQKVMAAISAAGHPNLLPLLGICLTQNERISVYPYLGNGTVASHLKDQCSSRPSLSWSTRKRIALSTAKGICYLHEHCHPKIVHGGVTTANIFLNEDFDAYVGDFALANMIGNDTCIIDAVRGTIGYMAPELVSSGIFSAKIDVYGYGIVLLELITGQNAFDISLLSNGDDIMLLDQVKRGIEENKLENLVDQCLDNDYLEIEIEQLIEVAMLCTHPWATYRPKMSEVVRMVENVGLDERWEEWRNKAVSGKEIRQVFNSVAVLDSTHNLNAVELSGPRYLGSCSFKRYEIELDSVS